MSIKKVSFSIYKIMLTCLLFSALCIGSTGKKTVSIMFDPAGNALKTGRLIGDNFERTHTLSIVHQCKQMLQNINEQTIVLFSRLPGEHINQLEKARFANQCNLNGFITLHAYHSKKIKPEVHIYYYTSSSPFPDHEQKAFVPLHNAYTLQSKQTKNFADHIHNHLSTFSRICTVAKPFGFACTPLRGITSPAICIEIGLNEGHNLQQFIKHFTDAINVYLWKTL